jgi:hypothetical protein
MQYFRLPENFLRELFIEKQNDFQELKNPKKIEENKIKRNLKRI